MAASISGQLQSGVVTMGQNGRKHQWGNGAFNSTDGTGTIKCRMHQVEAVILTPIGAPATDETLYWADTVSTTTGLYTLPANGDLTLGRTGASKTSGLQFSYLIIGR